MSGSIMKTEKTPLTVLVAVLAAGLGAVAAPQAESAKGAVEALVSSDDLAFLGARAAEKGLSVEEYARQRLSNRAPDAGIDDIYRYETAPLALSAPAQSGFHGRVAGFVNIDGANAVGDEGDRTVRLSAWRNERVNAQVVLWTKEPLEQVRLLASSLRGSAGEIPASAVSARFVRFTTASYVNKDARTTALVGDIIDDAKSLPMGADTFRPAWLAVRVPADAKPGVYSGTVAAVAAGGARVEFPVELEVLGRTLPDPSDWRFFLDIWQHPWAVARYHGVEPFSKAHYDLMRPLWKELAETGQKTITTTITELPWNHQNYDAYHTMIRHVKTRDGSFRRDYSLWDEYVAFCESCGLGPQIHCYTMATWGHVVYWEDEATGDVQKGVLKPGTPEHEAFWGPFLAEFRDRLSACGRLGRVYIALDERDRDELYATAGLIERYGKGLKLEMAGNKPPSTFAGIDIDNYCQYMKYITPKYLDEVRATRSDPKYTSTFYVCCGPLRPNTFIDSPMAESLWIGLYAAAKKMDGFLRWAYVNWPRDPFVDSSYGHWRPGDTFFVYPGCRTSVRWELLRDGIETCEKIRLLREEGKATGRLDRALEGIDYDTAEKQNLQQLTAAVEEVLGAVDAASR